MSTDTVGAHDPMVFGSRTLGIWIECECGWISPSAFSELGALIRHEIHVAAVVSPREGTRP